MEGFECSRVGGGRRQGGIGVGWIISLLSERGDSLDGQAFCTNATPPSNPVMHSSDDNTFSRHGHHALEPLMATSRDQPNPLRPYYIPPSIGLPSDPVPNAAPRASPSAKPSASPPKPSFGSQARDILSDLDYGVDISLGDGSPTVAEMAKKLLDQAVWNYTSVLFAQPFEVAKTVLQLHSPQSDQQRGLLDPEDARKRAAASARARYNEVCLSLCM